MIALGLDTTGRYCSVALVDEARVFAHMSENIGRGHAERLAPMVEQVLAQAGLKPDAIDKIGVCTGPGSFTGLRVALAFSKGFALPRNLPVIGLSSLAIELCWAAIYYGRIVQKPVTQAAEIARENIARLNPDIILEDPQVPTRTLAWLACELTPDSYQDHALGHNQAIADE